jgi:hypothetical protein
MFFWKYRLTNLFHSEETWYPELDSETDPELSNDDLERLVSSLTCLLSRTPLNL